MEKPFVSTAVDINGSQHHARQQGRDVLKGAKSGDGEDDSQSKYQAVLVGAAGVDPAGK